MSTEGQLYAMEMDGCIPGGLLSTTLPARGLFHDDPFCIGISGSFTPEVGLEYLAQADLVVAVGCSLAYHAGGGGQLWPKAKMLQIDEKTGTIRPGKQADLIVLNADPTSEITNTEKIAMIFHNGREIKQPNSQ